MCAQRARGRRDIDGPAEQMPTHDPIVAIGLFATGALAAGLFSYIHEIKRQQYLLFCAGAWGFVALHDLSPALETWLVVAPWQTAVNQWLLAMAGLLFFCAAQLYSRKKPWTRTLLGAAALSAAWVIAFHMRAFYVSPVYEIAAIFAAVGVILWQESRQQETIGDLLLALSFVLWGGMLIAVHVSNPASQEARELRMLELIPELFGAILMIMAAYDEEKRRVERNMLALSNLNLATSGFTGGEIQKMLGQALERILNVARIPAGAFFLHHGDPNGPTQVIATGLSESFCAATQENGLDDRMVELVSRLGGLAVFRDLGKDASWVALEREDAFRRFRQLALQHGLRSVVGISLQTKSNAFGLLLLSTPDTRRFTPAELRLLLALGHQIGMAVENSYLVKQTARRTEELRALNEIGRALSSMLDTEALFEKIYAEMKRLLNVDNFFIAMYDEPRREIRYELEIENGERLPKRKRPVGNHVAEYMLRTCEPILIRENFSAEVRRMGLQPICDLGCYCGAPIVLYGKAIAVMVALSMEERAFDNDHLELMRGLASQAAVAIENARLFREEQSKSRHLALLNQISQNIITTLNLDEVLSKISGELQDGLNYEHIGIGLLDYSSREILISAEAGRRRGALGLRLPLSGSVVGEVARTGRVVVVEDAASATTPGKTVLEGTCSAIALPLAYADQLHGVLYVESSERVDFNAEEQRFLHTLADLISGALHNAVTFQKTQEQAITDGLTGVKTHRFFMEALSAEWKRATRAGRAFSLMLMDLDRFKLVNDGHGHLEGDLVLQRVGRILEQNCRRSDVVARYGGDEFVVLMPETTIEQGRQLAAKLCSWIATDPLLREKNVTASLGIAAFPQHGSTPQELIQVADASMYLSKHQGGNTVSTADSHNVDETKQWKHDVLEAYLGVTLKRLFSTGPEAFEEIYQRLDHFSQTLTPDEPDASGILAGGANGDAHAEAQGPASLPPAVLDTVTSLALAIDAKDHYTQGHSLKVAAYAVLLCEAMGMSEIETEEVRLGALLHDIGKVGIPENILNKSGPLNPDEWETMKQHVTFGAKILEPLRAIARIRKIVGHHHEYFDGSGYPDGVNGELIPLGARIVAIADAYDTITSDRTYKKGRTPEDAMAELERCAGTQFDAELVRLFVARLRALPNPLLDAAPPVPADTRA
jgi:diguanylate cyclase (GGDEF)-like protein/putative nucleotidyltransferase with HDIG domain